MSSSVDQIKSKLDIVTVVSSYIKLDKTGMNFKGRCPFHNEKTPSFFISPDRGGYYCFGCHAKGDIFTFVQEFEGLDFMGALKVLAERAGVKLEKFNQNPQAQDAKERLFSVMEMATFFYEKQLSENVVAKEYVQSRGLLEQTIKDFRIGFAPAQWRELKDYLVSKGVTEKEMMAVGLIKQKEGTDSYYDTFRGRIMFPISDSSGRVVAFSGRILVADDKSPKYLNSPETELFNKSEVLFGLDKAKIEIRFKDYSVLVEGQMDLVMLHQSGIKNTVASSGTALSTEHLTRLRRLSNRIIVAFDGDSAGFSATNRGANMALSLGMELKVAKFPDGKDPADLARENPESLRDCLKDSKHIIDFYTDSLLSRQLSGRELGQEVQKNVLPFVLQLPSSIEKSHFIKSIAQKTFIKEDALWDDLKKISITANSVTTSVTASQTMSSRVESIEKKVIGIVFAQKVVADNSPLRKADLGERIRGILGEKIGTLETKFEKERDALVFETEQYYGDGVNADRDIDELLSGLKEEYIKIDLTVAMAELHKAEQLRDSRQVLKYLEDCNRLSRELNELKNRSTKT